MRTRGPSRSWYYGVFAAEYMRSFNLEDIQLEHQKTQLCGIACQSHNSTKLPALIDSTHTLCSPCSQRMVWKAFVWWIQSSESDKLQSNQAVMGDREKRSNQKLEMLTEMGGNLTPGDGDGADDLTTCFSYFLCIMPAWQCVGSPYRQATNVPRRCRSKAKARARFGSPVVHPGHVWSITEPGRKLMWLWKMDRL